MANKKVLVHVTDVDGEVTEIEAAGIILAAAVDGGDTTTMLNGHFAQVDLVKMLGGISHKIINQFGEDEGMEMLYLAMTIGREANRAGTK